MALLYNRTASIWSPDDNSGQLNTTFTHWALAHAGYDADFLDEDEIQAGARARYKVLYLDGAQHRRDVADVISAWVASGGVLCGSAGAGSRDEYNRPAEVLEKVFGARSEGCVREASTGRPKFELVGLQALGRLTPTGAPGAPATEPW